MHQQSLTLYFAVAALNCLLGIMILSFHSVNNAKACSNVCESSAAITAKVAQLRNDLFGLRSNGELYLLRYI